MSVETSRPGQEQNLAPAVNVIVTVLSVALVGTGLAFSADLFRAAGFIFYTEQFLGGMLTLALPLIYLYVPAGKDRARTGPVPWYDVILAIVGFLAAGYTAWNFPTVGERIFERPLDALLVGTIIILLIIEGVRRTVGNMLTGVVVVFVVFALLGHFVPGTLAGRQVDIDKLVLYLGWDPTAILGIPLRIVTTIVVAFVFFGNVLFKSGGSEFFTEISMVLMGRFRGGAAKISIMASSLFGSISGSVVSNVVTTGVITIPLMRRGGYKAHHAGAIEAVASTGGQLMPPIMGAAAFLMAEFLQIGYGEVVLAAIIPSLLFYVALFFQADLEAARSGIDRIPEKDIPDAWEVIKSGWHFPIPFVVLVVALFELNLSPEESALWAAGTVLVFGMVFGYKGKRLTPTDIYSAIRQTGTTVLDIVMIGGAAGIVIGVLNISGLGFGLTLFLVQLAGGSLIILLIVGALVCIVLGMGMPTVGVYILLAALVAPALIEVGIDPIAAHMFIMYYGMMSMVTPPVAIGAFAAATLTGADPMKTGFAAMRFGWLAFVIPLMFVGSTTLLLRGDASMVVIDLVTALIGTWIVSVAMMGYLIRRLGVVQRIVLGIAGIVLLVPLGLTEHAGPANIAAALVIGLLVGREILIWRSSKPAMELEAFTKRGLN